MTGALWLSLKIATAATLLAGAVGVLLAYAVSRRRFRGKSIAEALITLPLVLPPTVVGYLLLVCFDPHSPIVRVLHVSLLFRLGGAIAAAAVVALPLIYMPSRAAFSAVDREMEDIATLFGATRLQTFWHVSLPLARRGIASGLVLGFARALGEFGATMMVFGWQSRRVTLPVSIYADYVAGELENATAAVIALTAVSLLLITAYNRSTLSRQE
jgi:molybdate transport system permease protein